MDKSALIPCSACHEPLDETREEVSLCPKCGAPLCYICAEIIPTHQCSKGTL